MPHESPGRLGIAERGTATGVLRRMIEPRIARSALRVALLVGTVLNVVNNGERIWLHHDVNLWQLALNYMVPFCVSAYSAARNEARRARGE